MTLTSVILMKQFEEVVWVRLILALLHAGKMCSCINMFFGAMSFHVANDNDNKKTKDGDNKNSNDGGMYSRNNHLLI